MEAGTERGGDCVTVRWLSASTSLHLSLTHHYKGPSDIGETRCDFLLMSM